MKISKVIPLSLCAVVAIASELPNEISVEYKRQTKDADIAVKQISSSDTASLLSDGPGVSIASGGGMSNIPIVHGLADDRLKILVDGMPLTSTCPNHMNTPLSYIDPKKVETISVIAGIAPVSMGGDNIGGTISVESAKPLFAEKGKVLNGGELAGFFRSNSVNRGALISLTAATDNLSFNYTGSTEKASNYKDGNGDKVKATLFEQRNQFVTVAHKGQNGVLTAQVGQQTVPYQGYVNEYMDMLEDKASFVNLSYLGYVGNYALDARAFWKKSDHYMNKILTERTGNMPMYTEGTEYGYSVKVDIPLSAKHSLKVGNDFHRYTLDDWWPAVTTTVGGMGPNTFWNINNGSKDVFGLFAESSYRWSDKLASNIGVRADAVRMNTGDVVGYNNNTGASSTYNDKVDATAFNALGHSKQDNNFDITASMQYKNSATNDLEFGIARKTRSPNIHERYTWAGGYGATINGPIAMDMAMVNWFGDGNGYVGSINLKPEVAYTLSASSAWKDVGGKEWGIKVTPYYTLIKDFIDADYLGRATAGGYNGIKLFRFANHDAVLFGADVSFRAKVWESNALGKGSVKGVMGYTRGYRTDSAGGSLYHIMPLNAKISLEQAIGSWINGIDVQAVASKEQVDTIRTEPTTSGYALVDLRTNYTFNKMTKIDLAVTNLFNKQYDLPLGGINTITSVKTASTKDSLNGQGRSFNMAVSIKF